MNAREQRGMPEKPLGFLTFVSLRRIAANPRSLELAEEVLCPGELVLFRRAQTDRRRNEFLGGRLAAKLSVNRCRIEVGERALPLRFIEIVRTDTGSPLVRCQGYFPNVSITHSCDWAVSISSKSPCGVDIEDGQTRVRDSEEYFCQEELEYAVRAFGGKCVWTAKEAVSKVYGFGLCYDPHSIMIVPSSVVIESNNRLYVAAAEHRSVSLAIALKS